MYFFHFRMEVHPKGAVNVGIAVLKTVAYPFHGRECRDLFGAYTRRVEFINGKLFSMMIDTCEYDVDYMRKKFIQNLDYMYLLARSGRSWAYAYDKMRSQEGLFDYDRK